MKRVLIPRCCQASAVSSRVGELLEGSLRGGRVLVSPPLVESVVIFGSSLEVAAPGARIAWREGLSGSPTLGSVWAVDPEVFEEHFQLVS